MKGSKVKPMFYGDDELNRIAQHKFHAKIERSNFAKKVRGWKLELFAISLVILVSFSQYHKLSEEGILSYWIGLPLLGIILLYSMIKSLLSWFAQHIEMRDMQIKGLRRQLTCFICEASLGWIDKKELERLREAVKSNAYSKMDDLTVDDYSLISQAWVFWGENGFEWQDNTECVNCGHNRKEHSQDGECPTEKNCNEVSR